MTASFDSLPPEVVPEIVGHLPRPFFKPLHRAHTLFTRTASSASSSSAFLSQHLLFDSVAFKSRRETERWIGADARRWTAELRLEVNPADFRGRVVRDRAWLDDVLDDVLDGAWSARWSARTVWAEGGSSR